MAAHARLKNEFTEDEKYHNLMSWLILDDVFAETREILQNEKMSATLHPQSDGLV